MGEEGFPDNQQLPPNPDGAPQQAEPQNPAHIEVAFPDDGAEQPEQPEQPEQSDPAVAEEVHEAEVPVEEGTDHTHSIEQNADNGHVDFSSQDTEDGRKGNSKAWDMAHAGKEKRDTAAEWRTEASAFDSMADKKTEIVENLYGPAQEHNVARQEYDHKKAQQNGFMAEDDSLVLNARKTHDELYGKAGQLDLPQLPKLRTDVIVGNAMLDAAEIGSSKQEAEVSFENSLRSEAERKRRGAKNPDREAERLEQWAEILVDNPPSQAFLDKYDKRRVTARELLELENSVAAQEERNGIALRETEELLSTPNIVVLGELNYDDLNEDAERAFRRAGLNFGAVELMKRVHGDDSDEVAEWQRMQADPNTTLGQLRDLYAAAFMEGIRPLLERYKTHKAFLDDIRSGRASQWQ